MDTQVYRTTNHEEIGGGITVNTLKLLAIAAMLIDHIATVFVPYESTIGIIMHFIGRITGPTMFFFAVEGYRRTRNVNRYTFRLAVFAIVSYIPFIYCFDGALPNAQNFFDFNVIYTIFLGVLFIRARHEINNPVIKTIVMMILIILSLPGDWSYLALLITWSFDFFYGDFKKQMFAYFLVMIGVGGLLGIYLRPFFIMLYDRKIDFSIWKEGFSQMGVLIPILLLSFYKGEKGRGGKIAKWGFYIFYPLHLIILGLLSHYLK